VFYESGNKGISEDHMQQMKAIRDQYDPHIGRAAGSREMLGSKVRIALTGSGINDDAFKFVEVTGARLAETANSPATAPSTAGTLSIVEAEIYEPIAGSVAHRL
jgi:hypothetical protein